MASGRSGCLGWSIDAVPGCTTISLQGELDLSVIDDLRAALEMIDHAGVVLDLEALAFMDSTGLRLFIDLKNVVEGDGGTLVLRNVPDPVQRVLDVSGMGAFFEEPLPQVEPEKRSKVG